MIALTKHDRSRNGEHSLPHNDSYDPENFDNESSGPFVAFKLDHLSKKCGKLEKHFKGFSDFHSSVTKEISVLKSGVTQLKLSITDNCNKISTIHENIRRKLTAFECVVLKSQQDYYAGNVNCIQPLVGSQNDYVETPRHPPC